ncbi:MAG: MFS transporter [Anaerolineales bacterium]
MTPSHQPTGFRAFIVIWLGQLISILASGMTGFALSIWMYQKTESATAMGLVQVFYIVPFLLLSPLAGVWVDRYSRKIMMVVSDIAGGLGSVFLLAMFASGRLEFWHLYLTAALGGIGNTFQWPAYSAAIGAMIPKEQLGRVNGLMSLMEAGPGVVAPLLAGALLPLLKIQGILLFDVITFLLAVGALALVHIPAPRQTQEGRAAAGNLWHEAAYGFRYIFARPSLLGLQMIFFFGNLFTGIGFTVFAPMILARSGQNSVIFGTVQTMFAAGEILGGLLMTAWGGFKRRVHGVLLGWMTFGLGMMALGLGQGILVWAAAAVFTQLFSPLVNGSNQAIWQAKVAPDLQGRVFSARRLIAWFANPITPLIGGMLADFVLEPAMRGGWLPAAVGAWVGTGPGAGMGLLVFICGIFSILVGVSGYFIPVICNAEALLPDHEALPAVDN